MSRLLTGLDIPQANRLERVVERVRSVVDDRPWVDAGERDRAYYAQAAQVLGWLDEDVAPTPHGRVAARASSDAEAVCHALAAFEHSEVGASWLSYANATGVETLDPTSAEAFLNAASDLSESTSKRRAGTLRGWLTQLQQTASARPELVQQLRTFYRPDDLPAQVTRFLREPVDTNVPTRMANWAARHDLETFRDLLQHTPAELLQEKNLGTKSVRLTAAAIEDATGMSWDALHAHLLDQPTAETVDHNPDASGASPSTTHDLTSWSHCRQACPEPLRDVSIQRLDLPTRMVNFCARESVDNLGQLLDWRHATLRQQANLGRSSLSRTLSIVREFLLRAEREGVESLSRPSLDSLPDLFTIVQNEFAKLRPIDRLIITRRAGLHGDVPTLQELGDTLNVSRERIRQLEARASKQVGSRWWAEQARERILAALTDGACALETLAEDPFFPDADELATPLDFILHRVLDDVARVVTIDDQQVVCGASPNAVTNALDTMFASARKLVFPVDVDAVTRLAAKHAATVTPGLAAFFERALLDRVSVASAPDGSQRVTGFGHSRDNRILAYLEESSEPVSGQDIEAAFGRGRLPERAIYLARGRVGLPKHVPDFHPWSRRLVPLCVATMRGDDPGRQWSVIELLDEVSAQAQVPEWMGHWHLASMLRLSGQVRYLGRLQVALEDDAAPEERTYARDLVATILRDADRPLPLDELKPLVQARRGISENFLQMMLLNAPFVRVADHTYGLIERDLPGGVQALAEAADLLTDELETRQRGLGSAEALDLVIELSDAHAGWNADMLLCAARQAGGFRLNRSGGIGLAAWDDERLPTRRQTLVELVDEGGGRADVDAVLDAIEARFGSRPNGNALGLLANSVGLHKQGDVLLRGDVAQASSPPPAPELPDPISLPHFPPIARPLFLRLLSEELGDFTALRQQAQDYVGEFEEAHHDNEFIDPGEARALAHASAQLIDSLAPEAPTTTRQLVWAAVRYFVVSDDASSDFAIGGLDDDIGVFNAIATYLDLPDCCVVLP